MGVSGMMTSARTCTTRSTEEGAAGWSRASFASAGDDRPNSWRVAVIRDPVARAISAWKSKYACDGVFDRDGKLVPTIGKKYVTRGPEGHKGACFGTDLLDRARNVGNQMAAFGLYQYVLHDLSAGGSCLAFEGFLQVVANLSSRFVDASRVQPSLDMHLMSQAKLCGITKQDVKQGRVTLVDLETISQPSSPFIQRCKRGCMRFTPCRIFTARLCMHQSLHAHQTPLMLRRTLPSGKLFAASTSTITKFSTRTEFAFEWSPYHRGINVASRDCVVELW